MIEMRTIKHIFSLTAVLLSLWACADIDLQTKGVFDENVLLNSDYGVQKYFTSLYSDLPIEDFNYAASGDADVGYATHNQKGYHAGNIWQPQKYSGAMAALEGFCRAYLNFSGVFGYWPYQNIRSVNNFLEKFPTYKENFSEEDYNSYMGEARFLRAYYYFGLVKRYGGVPIIDKVQDPTAGAAVLNVPRSTEYDCWKFIYEDLKFAMENMSPDKMQVYRANRYAAAALMSETMLYAGSIAKYNSCTGITGQATERGYMGIDPSYAKEFFQYAYDACKFIHEAGYSLHKGADKVKAYKEVFLSVNAGTEDIFVKAYDPKQNVADFKMGLAHGWDHSVLPLGEGLSQQGAARLHGVWELLSLYEIPAVVDADGKPVRFDSYSDFWNNDVMEPRCKANFLFDGMAEAASGTVIEMQAGVFTSFPGVAADAISDPNIDNDYTVKYRVRAESPEVNRKVGAKADGTVVLDYSDSDSDVVEKYGVVKISGKHGCPFNTQDEDQNRSGIIINKYVDDKGTVASRRYFGSTQPWTVFRYGYVLMNWAEAAYELGLENNDPSLMAEAIEHVNEIRERAGAKPYVLNSSPADVGSEVYGYYLDENLQYIREERRRELCFENKIDWDMRRWRILHSIHQNYINTMFYGYHILDEDKYIFLNEVNGLNDRRTTYQKRYYYEDIPSSEIAKNDKLIHNDGY